MRKIGRIVIVSIILFLSFQLSAITAHAATNTYTESNMYYTIEQGSITIVGCFGSWDTVKIPASIGGYPVNRVSERAFANNYSVKYVYVPSTVIDFPGNAVRDGVTLYYDYDVSYTVETTSSYEGTTVANIRGGGRYKKYTETTVVSILPDVHTSLYEFVGWSDGNEIISTDAYYTFTVMNNVKLTAVYQKKVNEGVNVCLGGDYPYAVTIDGARTEYNGVTNISIPLGKQVTIEYIGQQHFQGWLNASGCLVCKSKAYTFKVISSGAIYANVLDSSWKAIFMTDYDQVYKEVKNMEDLPTTGPSKLGHDFVGWSLVQGSTDPIDVESSISPNGITVFYPVYQKNADEYTIEVTLVDTNGTTIGTHDPVTGRIGNSCTLNAPEIPGYTFQYWDNGSIVSYSKTYKFVPLADCKVKAVYGTETIEIKPMVQIVDSSSYKDGVKFVVNFSTYYENNTEIEQLGVIVANAPEYNSEDMLLLGAVDNIHVCQVISSLTKPSGTFGANLTTSHEGRTYYARAYMILPNGEIIYSDIVSQKAQ